MALRIRLFGKKRGRRRTGSERWGSYGEALFFAVFMAIGAGGLYLMLTQLILPQWEANQRFATTQCTVLDKVAGKRNVDGATLYRPEVRIRYTVAGEVYEATTYDINYDVFRRPLKETEEILEGIEVGEQYRCWYDPTHPATAVLVLGYSWWMWLLLLIPVSFMLLGGFGALRAILQFGASAERRAALADRASKIDLFDDGEQRGIDYPGVPRISHITDSPGTRLAFRLPADNLLGWKLGGVLALCLLWNGIVIPLFITALADWRAAGPHGGVTLLVLLPFLIGGLWLIYFTSRLLYSSAATGATRVEISAHPLYPGGNYELLVSQSGDITMNWLSLAVICEEAATYRQGTDTRTERAAVFEQELYRREAIRIEPGMAFEDRCPLHLPEGAMHSFQAAHNEIRWLVVVKGEIANRSSYERRFPIVVFPSLDRGSV